MNVAYVDTSALLAVAFGEPGGAAMAKALRGFDRLVSSNLLEAELRAAFRREGALDDPTPLLQTISWINPERPLSQEIRRVVAAGALRGADLWHLACALYLDPSSSGVVVATLDVRQAGVGRALGFKILPR